MGSQVSTIRVDDSGGLFVLMRRLVVKNKRQHVQVHFECSRAAPAIQWSQQIYVQRSLATWRPQRWFMK